MRVGAKVAAGAFASVSVLALVIAGPSAFAGDGRVPAPASAPPLASGSPTPTASSSGSAAPTTSASAGKTVPGLIVDTDMFSDVDDAGALAIANHLHNLGEVRLLAVMIDTDGKYNAGAASAIDTYYGNADVPIAARKPLVDDKGFYAHALATEFPATVRDGTDTPDPVALYRTTLAAQPDGSVRIASVGFLHNLVGLLESKPDAISPLSGADLIRQKVGELVVMGGDYPSGNEFNFNQFPDLTRRLVGHWPGPVVYSGFDVGNGISTGGPLCTSAEAANPVRRAYEIYVGCGNSRQSWDLTAVYYAVRGGGGLFAFGDNGGSNVVAEDGSNTWQDGPVGNEHYLKLTVSEQEAGKVLNDLMLAAP